MLCWSSREEIPHAQGKRNPSKMVGVASPLLAWTLPVDFPRLGFLLQLRSSAHTLERISGQEDQPHVQEAVAARAQEGLEELSQVEGQEGRR